MLESPAVRARTSSHFGRECSRLRERRHVRLHLLLLLIVGPSNGLARFSSLLSTFKVAPIRSIWAIYLGSAIPHAVL